MIRSALMNVMTAAARKAARSLIRDFGEIAELQVSKKGTADFVTTADHRAEKILFEELSKARPGYGFLMEESGEVEGSDSTHRWIVDPLDGTRNFLHSLPLFAISIALEREGVLVAGLIYNPIADELFVAEKGQGAWLNNHRLRVAQRGTLVESMVGCGIPHLGKAKTHGKFKAELAEVMAHVSAVRRLGAASLDLAYVAAGRYDAFWERNLQPWDIAAGIVLIREAGGFVTDMNGAAHMLDEGSICAGNEKLHGALLGLLKSA